MANMVSTAYQYFLHFRNTLTTAQILGTKPSPLHSFRDRPQSAHDQVDLSVTSLDLFSLTALCYNNFQTRRFDQARSRCPLP